MKTIPLFDDMRGKLAMAMMLQAVGRDELASEMLCQIADDAQRWRDHVGVPAHMPYPPKEGGDQ